MSDIRPHHFPPGTPVGKFYAVEGLVRLSEGRMYYLVHDDRPDQPVRKCWACGYEESPRTAHICHECSSPLVSRRFLMSSRWGGDLDAYQAYYEMRLSHPGLAAPLDVLSIDGQLLSFVPYAGEGLMLDEASPLSNQRLLHLAQRLVGTLVYLRQKGVLLRGLNRSNLLISPNGSVRLFDIEVTRPDAGSTEEQIFAHSLKEVAGLLQPYCHVRSDDLSDFLAVIQSGDYPSALELGRAIEGRFETYASRAHPPVCAGITDVGLARKLNEDSWGWGTVAPGTELYVVADGMGGHEGGEVASQLAVETLIDGFRRSLQAEEPGMQEFGDLFERSFRSANNAVKSEAERRGNDMGTTLVALLMYGEDKGILANVGDSRAYRFRDGVLTQITVDHSYVQTQVDAGKMTKEEARVHPWSNRLTKTVGMVWDQTPDLFAVGVKSGDRFLLCSDGLWGEMPEEEIGRLMKTYQDNRVAVRELVRAALQGGGRDNVTMIVTTVP